MIRAVFEEREKENKKPIFPIAQATHTHTCLVFFVIFLFTNADSDSDKNNSMMMMMTTTATPATPARYYEDVMRVNDVQQESPYLELEFAFDASRLAGQPHEYHPRLAVWSTDRQRMPDAKPGQALQWVQLEEDPEDPRWMFSTAPIRLYGSSLPIAKDPLSELCVVVQAKTLSDGHEIKVEMASRPYHIKVGQVNTQWYGILSHLDKHDLEMVEIDAPVQSLCGFESVVGELDLRKAGDNEAKILLKRAENEATRGALKMTCRYVGPRSDLAKSVRAASSACPGDTSPTAYMKQCEAAYQKSLNDYLREYKHMFPDALGRPFVRRVESESDVVVPGGEKNALVFEPDTKNMRRFHLPTWSTGGDHLPFVAWWLKGLTQPHDSDLSTQAYFRIHANVGLTRANTSAEEVIDTVKRALGQGTPEDERLKYATKGSNEHARFIRSIEATCQAVTALQLTCDYATDGRYTSAGKRIQTESPQRDGLTGLSRLLDCEDDEMTGALQAHLLQKQLGPEGMERPWSDPLLAAMVKVLAHMAPMNNFGAVRGAKLADGTVPAHSAGLAPLSPDSHPWGETRILSGGQSTVVLPKADVDSRYVPSNARTYFLARFADEFPDVHAALQAFLAAHPILSTVWRATLPKSDRNRFWRRAYHWIANYLYRRRHLVLEQLALAMGMRNVVVGPDSVTGDDSQGTRRTVTVDDFLERYYPEKGDLMLEPVYTDEAALEKLRYGGDPYNGDYTRYPDFLNLMPLLQLALVFWTWYHERWRRGDRDASVWNDDGSDSEGVPIVYVRASKLRKETIVPKNVAMLLDAFKTKTEFFSPPLYDRAKAREADGVQPDDDDDAMLVMHHQRHIGAVPQTVFSGRGIGVDQSRVVSECK
ncbi:MAG: hypothetical protein LC650_01155, partial [Actinobacteria bacterium]|nr:hypothetical protein [Actinomycetota bacterium]